MQTVDQEHPAMPDGLSVELSHRLAAFFHHSGADALVKAAILERVLEAADPQRGNLEFGDLPDDLQMHVRRVERLAIAERAATRATSA